VPAFRPDGPGPRPAQTRLSTSAPARFELSLAQVMGSAVAAVAAATVASTLGVAGTIAGAAVGAVVATVAGAIGTHSMRRAAHRLRVLTPRRRVWTDPTVQRADTQTNTDTDTNTVAETATPAAPPARRSPAPTAVVVCVSAVTVALVVGIARVTADLGAHPWMAADARELLGLAGRNLRSLLTVLHR